MGHGTTASPKYDVVTVDTFVLAGLLLVTLRPVMAIIGALFSAAGVYEIIESLVMAVAAYPGA